MNLNLLVSLEVFVITMLTVITWNQDSKKLHQCSREKSKIAREVIIKKVIPIFEQHQVSVPNECPFHLDRDYLWWPDDNNKHKSLWICPFCEVDFSSSELVALHWDQTHREDHPTRYRDDLVCLADYCDIFRCDVLIQKSIQRIQQQNFIGYLSFGNEKIPECDAAHIKAVKNSCRSVIRQCTMSLEANSSALQHSVEQELVDSVCSFLTCEHYYDDLFTDENASRKVSITLFFPVLGILMASGFCVCYYFIWTLFQRALLFASEKSMDDEAKVENELKFSFSDTNKLIGKSRNNDNLLYYKKTGNFFQNIFEFNQEHKEDTFEFNDFKANVSDYNRKLRSISSIIEEDEEKDKEKEDSDKEISYNSYPIISRKYVKRSFDSTRPLSSEIDSCKSSHGSLSFSTGSTQSVSFGQSKAQLKSQVQEIFLQDLPVKVHPKYIQPLKHSFSDRYPCYSGTNAELVAALSTKSRSYSHSQLRNAYNFTRVKARPVRQNSIDEEWEQKSQNSHSSVSIKSSFSASRLPDSNGKVCNPSNSSLSYNVISSNEYPNHKNQQTNHFASSSKSNSNASIASRVSTSSRVTSNSGQLFFKR